MVDLYIDGDHVNFGEGQRVIECIVSLSNMLPDPDDRTPCLNYLSAVIIFTITFHHCVSYSNSSNSIQ